LLIEAARLFDGETLVSRPSLVIEGGRVAAVGADTAPESVEHVDFGNATILPGLIDAHVHLCFDVEPGITERLAERDDDAVLEQMKLAAAHALRAGVTTVRDLGARGDLIFRLRSAIEAGQGLGPHILAAGRPLTIPMGHCFFLGGVAEDEGALLDLVRTEVDRGADVIKIMTTGGAMTPSSDPTRPQFPAETLRRAVELAHDLGRPVAAHAHSRAGIHDALAADVDTIEHGTFVGPDGAHVHDEDLPLLAGSRTVLVPTLIPIAARTRLVGQTGGPLAPDVSAADFWKRRRGDVARLRAAGAKMVTGSDCGVAHIPHDSVIDEIICFTDVGFTAADALAAATSHCADALGIGSVAGRLAPGFRADVLIVEGNPLEDLTVLRRPLAVYKAGERVG
jgi:imidazolonepropionase-like amidohydrolase